MLHKLFCELTSTGSLYDNCIMLFFTSEAIQHVFFLHFFI